MYGHIERQNMIKFKAKSAKHFSNETIHEGVYSGVSHDDYNSAHGLRRTSMTSLMTSAKYYKWRLENPMKWSDALSFGTAFHTAILEPEKFDDEFAIAPNVSKRTKAYKEFVEETEKTVIHPDDIVQIEAMRKSIESHSLAMSFLKGHTVEESAWSMLGGQSVKARSDVAIYDRNILVDLKTTQDASYKEFQRSSYKYKYDVQAAYYMDVFNSAILGDEYSTATKMPFDKFVFIAIDKNPPYDLQVYVADPTMIEMGRNKYCEALATLGESQRTNKYQGYSEEVINLSLPPWAE